MNPEPRPVRGVLFDFGNTLIPFGQPQMDAVNARLVAFLVAEVPGVDPQIYSGMPFRPKRTIRTITGPPGPAR